MWEDSASALRFRVGEIGVQVHQLVQLARVREVKLQNPGRALGVLIDEFRLVVEGGVDFGDDAARRGVDVARSLDRLHNRDWAALLNLLARRRKFDEGHVAKLFLGVIRDADSPDIAVNDDIFVIFGVFNERHGI